jgi:hypothetical protein
MKFSEDGQTEGGNQPHAIGREGFSQEEVRSEATHQ